MSARKIYNLPLWRLHPNEWNPNKQKAATFNELVEEIRTDGFDHPLQVVPWDDCPYKDADVKPIKFEIDGGEQEARYFRIIGGEHRFKAVTHLGWEDVPCSIYDWDAEEQRIKTVKRNLLAGSLDSAKFTQMVKDMEGNGHAREDLIAQMGFTSEKDFTRHVKEEKQTVARDFLTTLREQASKEAELVDGLSDILNSIFSQYGDTVEQDFLFFLWKGKLHMVVRMDKELHETLQSVVEEVKESKENMNDRLKRCLGG